MGVIALLFGLVHSPDAASPPARLKLVVPAGYLPPVPVLVRVEALDGAGALDRLLWDAEVTLASDPPGIILSTNRVTLRNGMGSSLVTFSGAGDFTLTASLGPLQASRTLVDRTSEPVNTAGGTLAGASTTWSGVVRVTSDVTVPAGHTLTIESNTLVLIDGVNSGTTANDLLVSGSVQSLGTETHPVTITCGQGAFRWGQIRHNNAQPSLYRHTIITRAGRAPGEGHTGQAPVIRPTGSRVVFDGCSITDHATSAGTPGKIGQASGSDLTFINCLLQRARMGPEIAGTSLACTNTWMMDMLGDDDADGIYLHDQSAGQQIVLSGCVVAAGGDDGIDTLGSVITVEDCIVRDWASRVEDAKGISVFSGATHVRRSLIVDCTVGIAAKTGAGGVALVTVNNSTIANNLTNVLAQFKDNAPGPAVDYRITNSVLWGGDNPVQSDFAETNFTIRYSNISEPWPGEGNLTADPLFLDVAAHDFHLRPYSPSIDSGNPLSPPDPDGSPVDQGAFRFVPPPSVLSGLDMSPAGLEFLLQAYTNRNYVIEYSTNAADWTFLQTLTQRAGSERVLDAQAGASPHRLYRARVAP